MNTVEIKRNILVDELWLPDSAIEDNIIDYNGTSLVREIIFEYKDKYWKTQYHDNLVGLGDLVWRNEDSVECVEVEKVQKMMEVWDYKK